MHEEVTTIMKTFLSAGDVLINPSLVAYAFVEVNSEGPRLRLGFSGRDGDADGELQLTGLEARSVLRWLRTIAEFLDAGSPSIRSNRTTPAAIIKKPVESNSSCRSRAVRMAL